MTTKFGIILGFGPLMSFEIAKIFRDHDFELLVIARSPDKIQNLTDKLGDRVVPHQGDASDLDTLIPELIEHIEEKQRLDLFLYHLGYGPQGKPSTFNDEIIHRMNQLSIYAPWKLFKSFKEDLIQSKGSFLVTGGGLALNPMAEYSIYSIGNAAKRNLVKTLYEEYRDKVHVATVTVATMVENQDIAKKIAEQYWELFNQDQEDWEDEIIFEG